MKKLYLLLHFKNVSDFIERKQIGVFDTRKRLYKIKNIYKQLPGFRNYKKGFFVKKIIVDYCEITKQHYPSSEFSNEVYFVYHIFENIQEDYEVTTFIGCFSTTENANETIKKIESIKKFNKGYFDVFNIQINHLEWSEGFTER